MTEGVGAVTHFRHFRTCVGEVEGRIVLTCAGEPGVEYGQVELSGRLGRAAARVGQVEDFLLQVVNLVLQS